MRWDRLSGAFPSPPLRSGRSGSKNRQNDTEGLALRVKLGVIPGEPKAREGDP